MRRLTINNFSFGQHGSREYVLYKECVSKTYQGGLKHQQVKPHEAKCFANQDSDRCLVQLLRKYLSLCPAEVLQNGLLLSPYKNIPRNSNRWYRNQYIGHNTLKTFVSRIMQDGGLANDGNFSNHSLRASTATRLFRDGVDEQLIQEQTGHRSVGALRKYKRTDDALKEAVSDVLQGKSISDGLHGGSKCQNDPGETKLKTDSCTPAEPVAKRTKNFTDGVTLNIYGGNVDVNMSCKQNVFPVLCKR